VTPTPKRAFALTKPVQLVVDGQTRQDSSGSVIDGAGVNYPPPSGSVSSGPTGLSPDS
jgi:hypothetical protein